MCVDNSAGFGTLTALRLRSVRLLGPTKLPRLDNRTHLGVSLKDGRYLPFTETLTERASGVDFSVYERCSIRKI